MAFTSVTGRSGIGALALPGSPEYRAAYSKHVKPTKMLSETGKAEKNAIARQHVAAYDAFPNWETNMDGQFNRW